MVNVRNVGTKVNIFHEGVRWNNEQVRIDVEGEHGFGCFTGVEVSVVSVLGSYILLPIIPAKCHLLSMLGEVGLWRKALKLHATLSPMGSGTKKIPLPPLFRETIGKTNPREDPVNLGVFRRNNYLYLQKFLNSRKIITKWIIFDSSYCIC